MRTSPIQKILRAAILHSEGQSQAEIAKVMRSDASLVSRWLRRAEEWGWLTIPVPTRPSLNTEKIPQDQLAAAKEHLSYSPLLKKLNDALVRLSERTGGVVPRVTISRSATLGISQDHWDRRIQDVGRAAAARFSDIAPKVRRVGITWGKTLRAFVDQIDIQKPGQDAERVCVPLCGEPSFSEKPTPYTLLASRLAGDLALKLGPRTECYELPVPASIPRECEGSREVLLSFFRRLPAYEAIFGGDRKGWVSKLDTIITSCGGASKEYSDPWLEARVKAEGQARDRWHHHIEGDVGGILFPRNQDKETIQFTEAINARWLGATKADFQRCTLEAAESKGELVGVVIIAHGQSKAPIVLHAIRERCVNEIICDEELAEYLLKHINGFTL